MALEHINEPPEFAPDVDPFYKAKMTPAEIYFAEQLSIIKRQNEWKIVKLVEINNIVVEHEKWFQRVFNPISAFVGLVILLLSLPGLGWLLGILQRALKGGEK